MPQKMLAIFSLIVSSFLCSVAQGAAPIKEGSVTGVVLTDDGQLAVGSKVCVVTRKENTTNIRCNVPTNDEARFTIDHLQPGTLELFAVNDAQGYSINNQTPEKVAITPDQLSQDITLHLTNKWGVIAASVTDKLTGKPLTEALVQYLAPDGCASGTFPASGLGPFKALPPDCDVVVIVTAKGYRGWVYTDPTNPSRPVLRLHPGEQKKLEVQLEPAPNR